MKFQPTKLYVKNKITFSNWQIFSELAINEMRQNDIVINKS